MKLPTLALHDYVEELNADQFVSNLRATNKALDMKEKDPIVIEKKKKLLKDKLARKNRHLVDSRNTDSSSQLNTQHIESLS